MEKLKIGVIVGSLRKGSYTRKIAQTLIGLAPSSVSMEIVEIGDLAIFNQDFDDEGNTPKEWTSFREHMSKFDAVLFATPEYNRSFPAAIKNALDIGSRPYGASVWTGKPGAVISVSPGMLGGFGSNQHLRQPLAFLGVPVMQQPEAFIGNAASLFDDKGVLTNQKSREFLQKYMDAFLLWIAKIKD
jgi:chromate reductase